MKISEEKPAGAGPKLSITLEDLADLWALYNILSEGDFCTARTSRKIKKESNAGGGSVIISVVKLTLKIEVVKVEYAVDDTQIRINGKACTSSEWIRAGQFHTLELGVHDSLTVEKDEWDYNARRILNEAKANAKHPSADSAAILMDAAVVKLYLMSAERVKPCGSVARAKVGKNNQKLHEGILMVMKNSFNLDKLKCIIIGGKQADSQDLYEWLFDSSSKTAVKQPSLAEYRVKLQGRKKLFVTGVCNGAEQEHLKGLMLQNEAKLGATKGAVELQILDDFKRARDREEGIYGLGHVIAADEHGAIVKLIINENLFKGSSLGLPAGVDPIWCRRYLSALAQKIERNAASASAICIINSSSLAYDDIRSLADIAAILKYAIPDLEPVPPDKLPETIRELAQ